MAVSSSEAVPSSINRQAGPIQPAQNVQDVHDMQQQHKQQSSCVPEISLPSSPPPSTTSASASVLSPSLSPSKPAGSTSPASHHHQQRHPAHHSDPRQLMPPLQSPPQIAIQTASLHSQLPPSSRATNQQSGTQSHSGYIPAKFSTSAPNPSTSFYPSSSPCLSNTSYTTSPTLTSASGHLAVPSPEKDRSRRWSLTGRFFNDYRRKSSSTEPSHMSDSTKQRNNIQAVEQSTRQAGNGVSGMKSNDKSPSGSSNDSSSRRSSFVEFPRAFLSSFRRPSFTSSSDPSYTPNSNAMAAATAAVSASIAAATGTSPRDGYLYKDRPARIEMDRDRMFSGGWLGGQAQVTMAIPKAPPLDARTLAMRAPPKSILKKRASDVEQNAMDTQNHGVVAPVAIISAGAKITKRENEVDGVAVASPSRKNSDADTTLFLADENVHPMDNPHITPTSDHRAKLVTNSPPPSHPQAHASVTSSIPSCSSTSEEEVEEEEDEDEEDEEEREGEEGESLPDISGMPIGGDGLPTARDDVYLSSKDTRDSIAIHASTSPRNVSTPSDSVPPGTQSNSNNRTQDRELSQAEMLNDEMMSVGARSQGYDRYGGSAATLGGRNVQAPKQRAINFADRIEVIPVHRKSDYNRQSDKHATFLNLTPELKNEIRGELNTFKLREMAVHENSVRNTAFH